MDTTQYCQTCGKPLAPNAPKGLCPECLMQAAFPTDTRTDVGAPPQPGFTPPQIEELAPHFPQLEILQCVGRGGMGAVYKARQPALDRLVALKILPPEKTANNPGFADRFTREARALARLNHPNIVGVHDFGRSGPYHFFIMEFVDGPNLRQVEQAGKLTPAEALEIIPQICAALQFAHDEGIVHRDIKPENILVDKRGRVKIADFGIAKILDAPGSTEALTGEQHVIGTPHYMAPEQIEKPTEVDHRADIYSLGVVFYEMLTGELPLGKFAAPSRKVQVDVRLDEVVLRALEKEPGLRYQQASALKTIVETISAGAPPAEAKKPDAAIAKLKIPAIGLLVTASFNLLTAAIALFFFIAFLTSPGVDRGAVIAFFLLVWCAPSILVLIGALRMLKAHGHSLAIVSCVLAMLSPGFLLGIPFAIWGLIVLSRRDVREAFEAGRANGASREGAAAKVSPHLSRTAIAGACWAALFFFTAFLLLIQFNLHSGFRHGPSLLMLLVWPFLMLSLPAPIGTTLLGWIAVSRIRRSAGRTYGLRLAVFDGLLFPLMALVALMLVLIVLGTQFMFHELHVSRNAKPLLFLWTFFCIVAAVVLNAWIVRRVWRAVKRTADGSSTAAPAVGGGLGWKAALISVLGALLLIPTIPVIWLTAPKRESPPGEFPPPDPRRPLVAPFVANLAHGTVELVAIAPHPSSNGPAWFPDGTLSNDPFPGFPGRNSADGKVMREIALKVRSRDGKPSTPVLQFDPEFGVGGMGSSTRWDDSTQTSLTFVQAIACPPGLATMNVRVGVANGDWENALTIENSKGGTMQCRAGSSPDDTWDAIIAVSPSTVGDVALALNYFAPSSYEARMAFVNADGKTFPLAPTSSTTSSDGSIHSIVSMPREDFEHVKSFLLQRRHYQWIHFYGVSIVPNVMTTVEVTDVPVPEKEDDFSGPVMFGPINVRMLGQPGLENLFLDLDTGRFVNTAPPGDISIASADQANVQPRVGLALATFRVEPEEWDAPAKRVAATISKVEPVPWMVLGNPPGDQTYFFRTSDGASGVLQLQTVPPGTPGTTSTLRVQYKLVQPGEVLSPDQITAQDAISNQMWIAFQQVQSGQADLALASLKRATNRDNPEVQDAIRDLESMQRLNAAQPWVFDPVVERVLREQSPDHRALNLASGHYVTSTPGRSLDFGPDGTNDLRTAGADLYLGDAEPERDALVALDFRELSEFFPQEDAAKPLGPLDTITADFFHLMQDQSFYHPSDDNADFVEMMKKRNLRPHVGRVSGTNLFSFITRDGAEGLLQISKVKDNPREIRVRYKLARPASPQRSKSTNSTRR